MLRKALHELQHHCADQYLAKDGSHDHFLAWMLERLLKDPSADQTALIADYRRSRGVLTHEEHVAQNNMVTRAVVTLSEARKARGLPALLPAEAEAEARKVLGL